MAQLRASQLLLAILIGLEFNSGFSCPLALMVHDLSQLGVPWWVSLSSPSNSSVSVCLSPWRNSEYGRYGSLADIEEIVVVMSHGTSKFLAWNDQQRATRPSQSPRYSAVGWQRRLHGDGIYEMFRPDGFFWNGVQKRCFSLRVVNSFWNSYSNGYIKGPTPQHQNTFVKISKP